MKTYIYTATEGSTARGYNRTINVYRVKNNKPTWIGQDNKINTASTYGDKGEAVQLIGSVCGHKHNNYKFLSTNIQIFEV